MDVNEILKQLTLEEKACLVTGAASMGTFGVERLNIPQKTFADGTAWRARGRFSQ